MECTVSNLSKYFKSDPALEYVSATFEEGRISVILGPSGSGKTTLLRCIAGLESANDGEIRLGETVVFDAKRQVNVQPHRRSIGMVFQSYGLWPHLSVADNIGFPLGVKGMSKTDVGEKIAWALDLVGLAGYGSRMPGQLSGGEQQRVALARAFASEPGILLMDEPLSNLDALLRESVRIELKELQRRLGITMIYITHDQNEALALADDLIVMRRAMIAQRGEPKAVYDRPLDAFVAGFLGAANLIPVDVASRDGDTVRIASPAMLQPCPVLSTGLPTTASKALFMVRPEDLKLTSDPENALWAGRINQRIFQGNHYIYVVDIGGETRVHVSTGTDVVYDTGSDVSVLRRSEAVGLALPDNNETPTVSNNPDREQET